MKRPGAIESLPDNLLRNLPENHSEASSFDKTIDQTENRRLAGGSFSGQSPGTGTDRVLLSEKQKISRYLSAGSPGEGIPDSLSGVPKGYLRFVQKVDQ
jgi:hypothetical protein